MGSSFLTWAVSGISLVSHGSLARQFIITMKPNLNILLLGGTGNISTDCASLLRQQGHNVILLTRGKTPVPDGYRQVVADRHDVASMKQAVTGLSLDVVIDFIGYDLSDLEKDFDVFAGRVAQYIFISTAMVYAKPHRQLPITETAPVGNELSEYAQKKLLCERWLLDKNAARQFPVTIVRPSHTYSSRWFPNVVTSAGWTFPARLIAGKPVFVPDNGDTPWTLTATSDFAVALAGLAGNEAAIGETFHITSDEALTWAEIYAETARALGAPSPVIEKIPTDFVCTVAPQLIGSLRADKSNPAIFDNAKIKRVVPAFVCRKPFATGIRESVEWYRAHPEHKTVDAKTDGLWDRVVDAWRSR
jgi:nucleoside-diphosphate-sugar epimerase